MPVSQLAVPLRLTFLGLDPADDTGTSNTDLITAAEALTLNAEVKPGAVVTLLRDGQEVSETTAANPDVSLVDPGPFGEGSHDYTAVALYPDGTSTEAQPQPIRVFVDRTPPETVMSAVEEAGTITVSIDTTEFSEITCSNDGVSYEACDSEQVYPASQPFTLNSRGVDRAGNVDPTPATISHEPSPTLSTGVSAGEYFSVGLTSDQGRSWGQNSHGQLGNGSQTNTATPGDCPARC